MHITGTVRLAVLVAEDGAVHELRLISGHPLLVKAMDAVKHWTWAPTSWRGESVRVATTVEITFSLGTSPGPPGRARPGKGVVYAETRPSPHPPDQPRREQTSVHAA